MAKSSLTRLSLVLCFFLISPALAAGGWGSGGGTGGVCLDSVDTARKIKASIAGTEDRLVYLGEFLKQMSQIEILDLREAKYFKKKRMNVKKLVLPKLNESFLGYAERIIAPYDKGEEKSFARKFVKSFRSAIFQIESERILLQERHREILKWEKGDVEEEPVYSRALAMPADTNLKAIPFKNNCVVVPIITQFYNTRVGGEFELLADPRVFFHKNHSTESRYVALLHEAMYLGIRIFYKFHWKGQKGGLGNDIIYHCFRDADFVRKAVRSMLMGEGARQMSRVFYEIKKDVFLRYPKKSVSSSCYQ